MFLKSSWYIIANNFILLFSLPSIKLLCTDFYFFNDTRQIPLVILLKERLQYYTQCTYPHTSNNYIFSCVKDP